MGKFTYSPREYDKPNIVDKSEKEYPTMYLDVSPEQLKGLDAGQDVEIVIRGKVKGLRYDTEDNYGTGASVTISLRSSDVKETESQTVIDDMLEDD